MEIYKISYENEKKLIIGIRSIDHATISVITDYLNNDEDVSLVRYVETHPELDDPQLVIVTRNGSAKDALIRAADSVANYFGNVKGVGPIIKRKVNGEGGKHRVNAEDGSSTDM